MPDSGSNANAAGFYLGVVDGVTDKLKSMKREYRSFISDVLVQNEKLNKALKSGNSIATQLMTDTVRTDTYSPRKDGGSSLKTRGMPQFAKGGAVGGIGADKTLMAQLHQNEFILPWEKSLEFVQRAVWGKGGKGGNIFAGGVNNAAGSMLLGAIQDSMNKPQGMMRTASFFKGARNAGMSDNEIVQEYVSRLKKANQAIWNMAVNQRQLEADLYKKLRKDLPAIEQAAKSASKAIKGLEANGKTIDESGNVKALGKLYALSDVLPKIAAYAEKIFKPLLLQSEFETATRSFATRGQASSMFMGTYTQGGTTSAQGQMQAGNALLQRGLRFDTLSRLDQQLLVTMDQLNHLGIGFEQTANFVASLRTSTKLSDQQINTLTKSMGLLVKNTDMASAQMAMQTGERISDVMMTFARGMSPDAMQRAIAQGVAVQAGLGSKGIKGVDVSGIYQAAMNPNSSQYQYLANALGAGGAGKLNAARQSGDVGLIVTELLQTARGKQISAERGGISSQLASQSIANQFGGLLKPEDIAKLVNMGDEASPAMAKSLGDVNKQGSEFNSWVDDSIGAFDYFINGVKNTVMNLGPMKSILSFLSEHQIPQFLGMAVNLGLEFGALAVSAKLLGFSFTWLGQGAGVALSGLATGLTAIGPAALAASTGVGALGTALLPWFLGIGVGGGALLAGIGVAAWGISHAITAMAPFVGNTVTLVTALSSMDTTQMLALGPGLIGIAVGIGAISVAAGPAALASVGVNMLAGSLTNLAYAKALLTGEPIEQRQMVPSSSDINVATSRVTSLPSGESVPELLKKILFAIERGSGSAMGNLIATGAMS